jgi:glucan phosphoethanolaminetransferase (alkaline phosphatase superfamily)
MRDRIIQFLQERIHFKQWEIAKYFLISCIMFSPALLSFFHHVENEYYVRIDNLLSFMAFSFSAFALLIIFRIPRGWTIPFVLAAIVGDAYHLAIGKPIGFQTMAAMYETNLTEMLGFLSSPYSIPLFLGGAAGAGAIIWYIVRSKPLWKLTKETHIRRYYLLWLMLLASAFFLIEGETILYTYPIDLFYSNYRYLDESHTEKEYLNSTYAFSAAGNSAVKSDSGELLVLIIGEAARRSALHAYDDKLETTPWLDKFIASKPHNVILFADAISGSAYTRGSVPTLLSTFDLKDIEQLLERPSLSKMFRGAGYKTLYVTTRPRYLLPNIVSIFQDDAEDVHYLSTLKNKQYDQATIPIMREFVKRYKNDKKFIIIHLMGSHVKYSMQYPKQEQFFNTNNKMLDSYYDTIRYSDKVIQQAVDIVMAQTAPGFVLYASDHGENLNDFGDGNWGHGTRAFTKFEFEIPFITYFNDSFLNLYAQKTALMQQAKAHSISQDNISHTFLGLAGIFDFNYYRAEADLSSSLFKPHIRYVIDENMNIYEYDKLNLKKLTTKNTEQ